MMNKFYLFTCLTKLLSGAYYCSSLLAMSFLFKKRNDEISGKVPLMIKELLI